MIFERSPRMQDCQNGLAAWWTSLYEWLQIPTCVGNDVIIFNHFTMKENH